MKRMVVLFLLMSLLVTAGCRSDTAGAHDSGKVALRPPPVSVMGHLYATKRRALFVFSGRRFSALARGTQVMDPAISADGSRLAFALLQGQSSVIALADARGAHAQPLTQPSAPEGRLWAMAPSFSADGGHLVYLTDRGKQASNPQNLQPNDLGIWTIDAGSGATARVVAPVPYSGGDGDPVYRPGSADQLLFTTYLYGGDPVLSVARLTWLNLRTGARVYLSPDGERNLEPSVSPDGRWLAFIHAGPSGDDLEVMPLADNYPRQAEPPPSTAAVLLVAGTVSQPVWSPDGRAIAFMMLSRGSFDLFVLPVSTVGPVHATGAAQQVTNASFLDADSRLAWGP